MKQAVRHEAHVPPTESQAQQQARFPGPHGDPGRPEGSGPSPEAGPETPYREDRLQVAPMDRERSAAPVGQRFPAASRIRKGEEIRRLMGRGKRRRTKHLDVFLAASPASRCRWGQVVPKHRHTLVERNRLRRRLREIGRTDVLPRLWKGELAVDVLVRARPQAYDASYDVLQGEVVAVTDELCSELFSSG